jgi:hypothetical protein
MDSCMAVRWVSTPDGTSFTYGTIPAITDPFDIELRCVAGEIRLPLGDVAKGSIHLNLPERKERFSPLSPEQFVYQVTSGYDEIWFQRGRGSLLLLRRTERRAAVLSLSFIDGIYGVVTAFPLPRDHNPRRRREVRIWSRP